MSYLNPAHSLPYGVKRILWGLWSSHFNSGRIRLSLDTAQKFRDVAVNHGDDDAALVGERTIGMSLFYLGDHSHSRLHAEAMLQNYSRPENLSHIIRFQFDPRIVSRTLLSKLLRAQGFPDQAMAEIHGVIEEATTVGHAMSLALALAQGACEVMGLVAAGLMNKQVGGELGICEITVKAHRGRVMRKMQAGSFAELVNIAAKLGITRRELRKPILVPAGDLQKTEVFSGKHAINGRRHMPGEIPIF